MIGTAPSVCSAANYAVGGGEKVNTEMLYTYARIHMCLGVRLLNQMQAILEFLRYGL